MVPSLICLLFSCWAGERLVVQPGESIQAALELAAGGGEVLLAAGVHTVETPLDLPSGVTCRGTGPSTVLRVAGAIGGPAIGTSRRDLHDVVLSDFTMEGPGDPRTMVDEPEGAPHVHGIFADSNTGGMQRIRLERLRITRFDRMGIHLKGVDHLSIIACDIDCSSAYLRLLHNVYLRRVRHVEVRGCLFRNSPVGNGLQVSWSDDVTIEDNVSRDNAGHGIRVAETVGALIRRNLVLGNDDAGIWLNTEGQRGCQQIVVEDNVVRDQGGHGISVQNTREAQVRGNVVLDNAVDFFFRNARSVTLAGNRYRTTSEEQTNALIWETNTLEP